MKTEPGTLQVVVATINGWPQGDCWVLSALTGENGIPAVSSPASFYLAAPMGVAGWGGGWFRQRGALLMVDSRGTGTHISSNLPE